MINLDEILKQGVEIQFLGKQFSIMQPTVTMVKEMAKKEEQLNKIAMQELEHQKDNKKPKADVNKSYDLRSEITLMILNNNNKNFKFTLDDVKNNLPLKIQMAIYNEVAGYIYDIKNDPN